MSKLKIIGLIIGFVLIALVISIGTFYFVQQKKLTVSYLISQANEPEDFEETVCINEDCDDSYQIKAKKYKYSGSKYFDEIVEMNEYSGDTKQYAFRVSTGWNHMENIEIGRIELPYADKNASIKCSYNFRGEQNWQPCTEKQFVKSLEKISALKKENGKKFEEIAKKLTNLEKDCEAERVNFVTCVQEHSKLENEARNALREVRNTTIELK